LNLGTQDIYFRLVDKSKHVGWQSAASLMYAHDGIPTIRAVSDMLGDDFVLTFARPVYEPTPADRLLTVVNLDCASLKLPVLDYRH
jgi:hypothetical protein